MPEVPKIVYARLRARVADAHPEPNLLTAFAEQSLSPAERESVLQHLAQCGDCREVIAIALPASESVPVVQAASEPQKASVAPVIASKARGNWFGWLGLRGLAFAAGVVIVASVLILRPGKSPAPQGETTTASVKTAAPPAMVQVPETATRTAVPQSPAAEQRLTASLKRDELRAREQSPSQDKLERRYLAKDLKVTPRSGSADLAKLEPGVVLRDNKRADLPSADKISAAQASPPLSGGSVSGAVAAPAVAEAQPQAPRNPAGTATETVEVSGASPVVVETQEAAVEENTGLSARSNDVVKAKNPVQAEKATAMARTKKQASGASSNYAAAYQNTAAAAWRLYQGVLQHSLDAGFSWQTVLRADHSLLCQKDRGSDIWAAGQAGTVFHSSDAGATWTELHPAVNDQHLTADVTAITLEKPGETVLTTSTGESWTTMDNGKTWSMTGTIKK